MKAPEQLQINPFDMNKWLNEISLEGTLVQMVPMRLAHIPSLIAATEDGRLWELWYTSIPRPEEMEAYVQKALDDYASDLSLPFVVIEKATGKTIGSTRYMNAFSQHRRLEIGTTWYAQSAQRTGVNTECKYLLLQHAFEILDCIAVEFRTHWHNLPSRQAIARLGAKQDGVMRNHSIDATGQLRDTVVFSILNSEWGTVKKSLAFKMNNSGV